MGESLFAMFAKYYVKLIDCVIYYDIAFIFTNINPIADKECKSHTQKTDWKGGHQVQAEWNRGVQTVIDPTTKCLWPWRSAMDYVIFMNRPFGQNRGLYNRSQVMQRVIRMRNRIWLVQTKRESKMGDKER